MLTHTGLRPYLMQAFPKRTFTLVVDQECLEAMHSKPLEAVLQLIIDLRLLSSPINIRLVSIRAKGPIIERVDAPRAPFTPKKLGHEDTRHKFLGSDSSSKRLQELCVLAQELKADGLVTSESDLIAARYTLYQHDLVRVVPISEFSDLVEICAHGHGVFWSATHDSSLIHDIYYPLAHPVGARFAKWLSTAQPKIASQEIHDHLRSVIYNRYPFILYARDMVRFYQLQKDSYKRIGHPDRFGFPLGYHQNMFSLLVWGMLEHLCVLVEYDLRA